MIKEIIKGLLMNHDINRGLLYFFGAGFILIILSHIVIYDISDGFVLKTLHLFAMSGTFAWLFVSLLKIGRTVEEMDRRLKEIEEKK